MSDTATRSPAQPAVVLGLTFLMIGLTFALPYRLIPETELKAMSQYWSPEVGNVYACVAWMGWAHFVFAFRGQGNALTRIRDEHKNGRLVAYIACIALAVVALAGLRWGIGLSLFGAVVWIYFIDHFLKAEQTFEGKNPGLLRWLNLSQPLLTFTWLSVILLDVGQITSYPWPVWIISLALGTLVLVFGGWQKLVSGDVRTTLLSLFFVAEALVWGTMSRYGGQAFLTGVNVFHIAAGSYFHYFGSYFFANAKAQSRDKVLTLLSILAVNAALIALGYFVAYQDSLRWLSPVLGVQWFSLWVAVHLVSSDVFPLIKTWKQQGQRSAPVSSL